MASRRGIRRRVCAVACEYGLFSSLTSIIIFHVSVGSRILIISFRYPSTSTFISCNNSTFVHSISFTSFLQLHSLQPNGTKPSKMALQPQYIHAIVSNYTPQETTELCGRCGYKKANMRVDKIFMSAVMGGMLLSFACAAYLNVNSSPWFQENAPGLIKTIGALVSCFFFFGQISRIGD